MNNSFRRKHEPAKARIEGAFTTRHCRPIMKPTKFLRFNSPDGHCSPECLVQDDPLHLIAFRLGSFQLPRVILWVNFPRTGKMAKVWHPGEIAPYEDFLYIALLVIGALRWNRN